MPNGRCRLHGGKALAGEAHGRYKHGRLTRAAIAERRELRSFMQEARAMVGTARSAAQRIGRSSSPGIKRKQQQFEANRAKQNAMLESVRTFARSKGIDLDALSSTETNAPRGDQQL